MSSRLKAAGDSDRWRDGCALHQPPTANFPSRLPHPVMDGRPILDHPCAWRSRRAGHAI